MTSRRYRFALVLLSASLLTSGALGQTSAPSRVSYTVRTDTPSKTIDQGIYGQFLEHIYNSVHGGLWGDLILNGTLESRRPRNNANPGNLPLYWEATDAPATTGFDRERPLNGEFSLRITRSAENVQTAGLGGIRQLHVALRKDDKLTGSVYLRGTSDSATIEFRDADGVVFTREFTGIGFHWQKFNFEFTPSREALDTTLTIGLTGAGEVFADQVSMFPASALATGGFRPDLLKAIMDLKPASIRWPGGSFVNTYVWQNGIGPMEKRISHPIEIWNDRDPNQFGTDEFMRFCEKIGAEPIIVLNTARGVQDALDWLEYCMGDESTHWGKVRAQNGRREPYKLKTIEIDNETWLLMDKPAYVKIVKDFAPAIRAKYPNLKLSICGSYAFDTGPGEGRPSNAQWDQTMLEEVAPLFDILSPHYYNGLLREHPADYVDDPRVYEKHLIGIGELIQKSKNPNIKIYMSEWNLTSSRWGNDWRVGMYAGGILNALERQSDRVVMSCPALFMRRTWATAWNNALINFDQKGWFPAGNYVVMKLFRESYAPGLLAVDGPEKPLNLTATRTEDRQTVYLKLVNPEPIPAEATFQLQGTFTPAAASMQLIAPGSETAKNSMENTQAIAPQAVPIATSGKTVAVTLPPYSVGVVHLRAGR